MPDPARHAAPRRLPGRTGAAGPGRPRRGRRRRPMLLAALGLALATLGAPAAALAQPPPSAPPQPAPPQDGGCGPTGTGGGPR
jgi:hypothetical protein